MSTKVSYLYGKNYHLYFDFKDDKVHLEINGREVELPDELQKELERLWQIYDCVKHILRMIDELGGLEFVYVGGNPSEN